MRTTPWATESCSTFSMEARRDIVLLRLKVPPLLSSTDLSNRDNLVDCLDRVAGDPGVKVVVIIGNPEKKGVQEYDAFISRVAEENETFLRKMLNVFNQIILKIAELDKVVVIANSGKVLSQCFHVSLAADYRILASNSVVQKAYIKHGLMPLGGGAFFLSQMLGRAKAYEVLLSDQDMTAAEVLEFGLADEVVPLAEIEDAALTAAQRFARHPAATLAGVKRLMNYTMRDLRTYLDFEHDEMLRTRVYKL